MKLIIIGTSCSGKSTLAGKVSEITGIEHIELDYLQWLPDWQCRSEEEFRDLVKKAAKAEHWIIDGNYSIARDIHWAAADMVIWLNYSFPIVFYRALKRSIKRMFSGEEVCNGNKETIGRTFFNRESILLWVIKTHRRRKDTYQQILDEHCKDAEIIIFRKPADAEKWLKESAHNIMNYVAADVS